MVKTSSPKIKSFVYPYHLDVIGRTSIPSSQVDLEFVKYRGQWEMNPRDQVVSDFPLHLDVEATGNCNLMCNHCLRYSRRTTTGDMDMDLFKKIIDEGGEHGLCAVDPSWMGESFLHPGLMDMVDYAKSRGVLDVMVHTNGTLVDEEMSQRIFSSGLDTIIFSIDAVTEDTYNMVKFGSDFKEVNQNIEYLIELKEKDGVQTPTVVVQMIDQEQSHEELMVDRVRIAIYQSPDGKPNDKKRVQNSPETIFPCPQLWQRLVVAWDGTVYPCSGDNACREPLGNVKETSIYDIWHGDRLNYLREVHGRFEADTIDACLHCDINKVPEVVNDYMEGGKNGR
jgi:radical SAM protein with 4Fe4S-binding SPASM domain